MSHVIKVSFGPGDVIWVAGTRSDPTSWLETCPDCGGQGRVEVVLHGPRVFVVGCPGCGPGDDLRSRGQISRRHEVWKPTSGCVASVRVEDGKVEYVVPSVEGVSFVYTEDHCFPNTAAGIQACQALCDEQTELARKAEQARFYAMWAKRGDSASGAARTATYYLGRIRKAEAELTRLREIVKEKE